MLWQMTVLSKFLWLVNVLLYMCITFSFIHSSFSGHLGCFYVLAIVNDAIATRECFFNIVISFLHINTQKYGGSIFNFLRNLHTVFHSAPIHIPTNSLPGFSSLQIFTHIVIFYFFELYGLVIYEHKIWSVWLWRYFINLLQSIYRYYILYDMRKKCIS